MSLIGKLRCFVSGRVLCRSTHSHRPRDLFAVVSFQDRSTLYFNTQSRFFSGSLSRRLTMNRSDKRQTGKPPQKDFPGARSHATRSSVPIERQVEAERAKYMSLSIEEKRKIYKCRDNFLTLKDIATWPEYEVSHMKESHSPKKGSKSSTPDKSKSHRTPKFPVNEKLNKKISLFRGDITSLEIDAIVNAANGSLMGGGGVDGAIHSAAGSLLKQECSLLDGCDTGDAKISCGYKLPARYVIHTVGPIGEKPDLLHSAYRRSLEVFKENSLTSVAFPCISTGIYGYPVEAATHVALETIRKWLDSDPYSEKVERVILCVFLKKDVEVYESLLPLYFPRTEDGNKGKKAVEEDSAPASPDEKSPKDKKESTDAGSKVTRGKDEGTESAKKEEDGKPEAETAEKTLKRDAKDENSNADNPAAASDPHTACERGEEAMECEATADKEQEKGGEQGKGKKNEEEEDRDSMEEVEGDVRKRKLNKL